LTRLIAGFIATAFWLPAVVFLAHADDHPWTRVGVSMVPLLTLPLTLLAVPLVYFGRRRLSFTRCLASGAAFGVLGAAAVLAWARASPFAAPHWFFYTMILSFMTVGLVSGAVFWLAGVWRNDNLTKRWRGP